MRTEGSWWCWESPRARYRAEGEIRFDTFVLRSRKCIGASGIFAKLEGVVVETLQSSYLSVQPVLS